jgi:hypothetical protein
MSAAGSHQQAALLASGRPQPSRYTLVNPRRSLEAINARLEKVNAGLVIALAWCVAVWLVLVGLLQGYVF